MDSNDAPPEPQQVPRPPALLYRFENIVFDEAANQLLVDNKAVAIEPRPLRLLAELLHHVNEVVTKEDLFESVWDGRPTVDNVLPTAINRLRKALGEVAARRIVNLPRVGYRFDGPMDCVTRDAADAAPPVFQPGTPVPGKESHVFVRSLGEGASSRVWLVRHAKLGAERVFKFGFDAQALRALKREFTLSRVLLETLGADQTVAVPLKDANFAQPPFFLEMDYGGLNLRQWAEEDGRLQAMALPERLALFVQIARAVAAAHSVGVLHKDIKPANVLVKEVLVSGAAGAWVAKLTDFGSGRALDPDRLKDLGLTALGLTQTQVNDADASGGTPLYLAPELLAGAPATLQSDVYALGVVLYQVVVANFRSTLSSGWQREVANELLVQDILAATDGDPLRRLASAADLAERVGSLAQRQKVRDEQQLQEATAAAQAAASQAAEHRRQARRPWLVAAAGSLLLGLAASLYFQWQSRQALLTAQDERQRATTISDFLQRDLLESPDILTMGSVRPAGMLQLLRTAAESAGSRFAGRPLEEAALRRRLAEAFTRLASLGDARVELIKARKLLEQMVPADDTELLTVRFLSAHLHAWSLRFDEALQDLNEVEGLAGAVRLAQPTELAYHAVRARHELMFYQRKFEHALPNVERLVSLADVVYANTPHQRADARQRKAEVLYFTGQAAAADALVVELEKPPFNAKRMVSEFKLRRASIEAETHEAAGRWAEAATVRVQGRAALLQDQPPNAYFLAWADANLADTYHAMGNFVLAQQHYEAAIAGFERTVGDDHQYVHGTRLSHGFNALALGRPAQAFELMQQVQRWNDSLGKGLYKSVTQMGLAMVLTTQGQATQSAELLQGLDTGRFAKYPHGKFSPARIDAERARALLALRRPAEALALLPPAIAALEKANGWPWLVQDYQRLWLSAQAAAPLASTAQAAAGRTAPAVRAP